VQPASFACMLPNPIGTPAQNVLQQNCNPITTVLQPHQNKIHILDITKPQFCSHIKIKSIFWTLQNKSVHHIYTHTVHIIDAEHNHI